MATEKGLKRLIFLYTGKIKRLQDEIQTTIARNKIVKEQLRDLKWIRIHPSVFQGKKAAKPYPDKIDKAIETMAAKILKKATKKTVKKKA